MYISYICTINDYLMILRVVTVGECLYITEAHCDTTSSLFLPILYE